MKILDIKISAQRKGPKDPDFQNVLRSWTTRSLTELTELLRSAKRPSGGCSPSRDCQPVSGQALEHLGRQAHGLARAAATHTEERPPERKQEGTYKKIAMRKKYRP